MSELLKVENLTIKSATQTLVDNLSYTLHTGDTLASTGSNVETLAAISIVTAMFALGTVEIRRRVRG